MKSLNETITDRARKTFYEDIFVDKYIEDDVMIDWNNHWAKVAQSFYDELVKDGIDKEAKKVLRLIKEVEEANNF